MSIGKQAFCCRISLISDLCGLLAGCAGRKHRDWYWRCVRWFSFIRGLLGCCESGVNTWWKAVSLSLHTHLRALQRTPGILGPLQRLEEKPIASLSLVLSDLLTTFTTWVFFWSLGPYFILLSIDSIRWDSLFRSATRKFLRCWEESRKIECVR